MWWALETGGPLGYRIGGRECEIPPAVSVPDEVLLAATRDPVEFAYFAEVPEGVPYGQVEILRRAYCRVSGLLEEPGENDRLASILTEFGSEIEVDLPHIDIAELWQARRWRRLRNLIDHIPQASFYVQKILNDPEMVALIHERQREGEKGKKGFPVSEYSRTVEMLTNLGTELRLLRAALIGVNSRDGRAPKVEPYPGAITVAKEVDQDLRRKKHENLVARVLPSK